MPKTNLSFYDKKSLPNIKGIRFGIVLSNWNRQITNRLLHGVIDTFHDLGVVKSDINIFEVPGSFELIFSCHKLAKSDQFDAIISIGCLIKGETQHFDYVCSSVTAGIKDINLYTQTPVILCVLTDNHISESFDRSGGKYGNKGVESAISAIKMANFNKHIRNISKK